MKVVVNKCYGGFSLSPQATAAYAKRKGRKCYFFEGGLGRPYQRITQKEAETKYGFHTAFDVPELPEELENGFWDAHNNTSRPEDRSDPDLVAVVEKLGSKANGSCANLEIVEIPDSVEWTIEEYDGQEWVAEKHRTW